MENLTNNTGVLQHYVSNLIAETVFPENGFMNYFMRVDQYLNAKTVSLPFYTNQAGVVSINSTAFDYNDLTQSQQAVSEFSVDQYRIKPFHIEDFETDLLPFDIIATQSRSNLLSLESTIASYTLKKLAADVPVANIISTSGANGVGNSANGATNKKKITLNDFIALNKKFDESNLKGERYIVVDALTFSEILSDSTMNSYFTTGYSGAITEGTFPKVLGINVIKRSHVAALTADGATVKSFDAGIGDTLVDTDVRLSLAFVADVVAVAMSAPKIYVQSNVPQLYGTVMSWSVNFGAKNTRQAGDKAGVYLIKQG